VTAEESLHGYLVRAIRDAPGAPAVRDRRREVSYRQLGDMVTALAGTMRRHSVRPGARVGIWLNKSLEAIVGIHAAVRSGIGYVPVDPVAPAIRAAHIIADCDVSCLLTTAERAEALACANAELPGLLIIAGDPGSMSARGSAVLAWDQAAAPGRDLPAIAEAPEPDCLAYILYTSGSTGVPKGVTLTHRNARAFVDWAVSELELAGDDVFASHAPLHFDLSILDVFGAAAARACLVLVPDALAGLGAGLVRFAAEQGVTVWYSVPVALRRMASAANAAELGGSRLRVVAFAGETYPVSQLRILRDVLPRRTELYNLYGPTETNVCTYHRVREEDLGSAATAVPPIGRPCPYAVTALIGDDGAPLAETGEAIGELCVAGASLMVGYWSAEAATEARMIALPGRSGLYYRTGDIVRRDPAGRYYFIGRRDSMVKVRGCRVEPGEVEAALAAYPGVADSACVTVPDPGAGSRLVAFVTVRAGHIADEAALRRHCRTVLPRYMIPERLEVVPALPRTSTGKTDRRMLALLAEGQDYERRR
jgi:L-proline---[L-prolyl-carrier protein] ligase